MRYASDRIILYDRSGAFLGELNRDNLLSVPRMVKEVNGEHSLSFETSERLPVGTYALWRDGKGEWHEWVVTEPREGHGEGEYYLVQSMQHDLQAIGGTVRWASAEEGTHDPITERQALEIALQGQGRWQVGRVEPTTLAGASLYNGSLWEYVNKVRETWGGELHATIEVDATGVISRKVDILSHVGETEPTRRFDWGEDVSEIVRTPSPAPYYCRVRPYGGSVKTDSDGVDYSDCVGIEDIEPDGHDYIQDDDVVELFRLKNPDGTYEYPTVDVVYNVTETKYGYDDEELYQKALAEYRQYTRPKVTYEANVVQYARAGLDYQGVDEGDEIQVVDRGFDPDVPLRLQERVIRIEQDLPVFGGNPDNTELTIGSPERTIVDTLRSVAASVNSVIASKIEQVWGGGTIVYLDRLVDELNAEINATGGYAYYIPGIGIRTYDCSVTDPAVGTEASQVIEIRGGAIRIANSRTPSGDWDWRSVFVSGHIAADLVTAANITTGFIGTPGNGSYWDLDNNILHIGTYTAEQVVDGINATIKGVGTEWVQTSSQTVPPSDDDPNWSTTPPTHAAGRYVWERTAVTHGNGTVTHSDPVMISGRDGVDGRPGTSVTVSKIEYGISTSASSAPESWTTTAPTAVAKGVWLWVRTTYSDSSTATNKSYIGTDGEDGTSVTIQSSDKTGKVTTVTFVDGAGHTTPISIRDGEDGAQGIPGAAGWVHVAWATSADGSQGFSTTDSVGKTYVGIYTDQTEDDSTDYSDYSWSLIKGADGQRGSDGLNQATIMLYQRKATKPQRPSAQTTYTFATKTLAGSYSPWSTEIPDADGNPCWVTAATASSATATDTIAASEWADVAKLVEDGGDGTDGLNQATIMLYRRGGEYRVVGGTLVPKGVDGIGVSGDTLTADATVSEETATFASLEVAVPSSALTYTFATGELAGDLGGWSRTIPDGSGIIWVTSAVAISTGATDSIATTEWATPARMAEDGESVNVGTVSYAVGGSGTTVPDSGWTDEVPETIPGQWLWVRTTYTDGTYAHSCSYMGTDGMDGTSVSIQSTEKHDGITTVTLTDSDGTTKTLEIADGEDGDSGTPGANGYVHVAWALSADGSQGFSTSESANKTYIGVYTDHTEADSQDYHAYSWSLIKGADGRSVTVSSTVASYVASSSGTTVPSTGWQSEVPTVAQGKYLWTRVVVTYSDTSTATSYSAARQGADGMSPTVSSTTIEYQQSASGTVVPTGTWMAIPPAATAGQYMWTRTTNTYTDNAQSVSYSVAYNGKDGTAAYTYTINSNPAALVRAENGTLTPPSVTFSATRAQGTGTPSAYAGRFVISEYDGSSWADRYTSSSNESSKAYSPTSTAKVVRCSLYMAGGTTTLLDTQSAPIVSNGATGAKGDKGETGASGADGLNHATVYLYKRTDSWSYVSSAEGIEPQSNAVTVSGETATFAATVSGETITPSGTSAPSKPSAATTYTFSTAALSGDTAGWSRTIPDGEGTVWVTTADAVSAEPSVTLQASAWSAPARLAEDGSMGVGIASISISYGSSSNPTVNPTSWQDSVPFLMPGEWLWIRTTYAYTDGNTTSSVSKSYVGTDGEDGKSVYVKESSKTGGVTTITLVDGNGEENTITINDGEDGSDGIPGASGYVHTAWANSANGQTDFSTTESAGKKYLGVYTDNTAADSTNPSAYSWSLIKGADGTSVTVSKIEYGTSNSASAAPSSYSTTVPTSIAKGKWLWVRTTYSDSSTATSKTYVGTDGQDGTSVYVTSTSKSGKTTTVDLSDGTTLTIVDGADGTNGTPGANGYVHTAWANSSDGSSGFSTTDSANKSYLGVYTDNTAADSTSPSAYSWSLIKGAKGDKGATGDAGADAYTVLLTNESHTFAASTAAAISGSTTSQVIAYEGATQVPATIGTITGAPSGMTTTVSSNGTTSAYFTVTVTTSLTTRQGTLNVPVTVDGHSFTLKFSWALALTGATGAKGDDGADGLNNATVYIYQRTLPWTWSQDTESVNAPAGVVTVSGETATFASTVDGEAITPDEAPAPTAPTSNTTYTFATSTLSGNLGGWSQDIPDGEGTIWVTTARASSDAATDTIAPADWATVAKLASSGATGLGITRTDIVYGVSASPATRPTSWVTTVPFVAAGQWMWIRTTFTYTDGTTDVSYSQSYVGTDGNDGVGVAVTSVERSGTAVTIKMVDTTGHVSEVTLNDGEDGERGQAGASGYVHFAWANSANGSVDFTTHQVSGKTYTYMGVYTDDKSVDSQQYSSYTWTLIKGAKGDTGKGVSNIVTQYYLSTSKTSVTGGSWSTTPATYVSGRYYWTRDYITWSDGNTTTTTAVLDNGLNGAYEAADDASKVATNFLDFNSSTGLDVSYSGTNAKARINGSGLEIYDSSNVSVAKFQTSGARLGKTGDTRLEMDYHSMQLIDKNGNYYLYVSDLRNANGTATIIEQFYSTGTSRFLLAVLANSIISVVDSSHSSVTYTTISRYPDWRTPYTVVDLGTAASEGATVTITYTTNADISKAYTFGIRSDGNIGPMSFAEGYLTNAIGAFSHAGGLHTNAIGQRSTAIGNETIASGSNSIACGNYSEARGGNAIAAGSESIASGANSIACGDACVASGVSSMAFGDQTLASGPYQMAIGTSNVSHPLDNTKPWVYFVIGRGGGTSDRKDAMTVDYFGNVWISGSYSSNSDRRLKEHVAYLGDDAAGFVRELRPALFVKDGERHTGFYAQDVQEAEPDGWDTSTVTSAHTDESLDFDPLTLDYTALIAPLVAYAQALERRIEQQQETIDGLIGRIEALEGRM